MSTGVAESGQGKETGREENTQAGSDLNEMCGCGYFNPSCILFLIPKVSPSNELMEVFSVQTAAESLPVSQPGELRHIFLFGAPALNCRVRTGARVSSNFSHLSSCLCHKFMNG